MERRELSVVELADKAEISMSNLYGILRGDVSPTLDTTNKLAKVLKLTVTAQ